MKSLSTLILSLLIFSVAYTQNYTQTIKGVVVDKQSGSELPGANVIITSVEPIIGVATDANGRFILEDINVGRHAIKISLIGYETSTLSNLELNSAKQLNLRVELEETVTNLETVTITAKDDKREALNKMSTVSARTLSIEEAGRYSGALADPSRMAQNFAGVSGASDDRNDIIVRGNSPTGVLWRLEGIDIPSPNHFSTLGNTGGPISMLNINNLDNSDFMTSAFAAEYGNALSGVFDLQMKNGNADKREYMAQIGFNGFELGAEGPFKKGERASYLVNYRYSTLGVFSKLGIDLGTGAAVPEYQDLTFKINAPIGKKTRLFLFGIGGNSGINFLAEESTTDNLYLRNAEDTEFTSETGIIGTSLSHFFNKNTSAKLILAATSSRTKGLAESVDSNFVKQFVTRSFNRQQDKLSAHLKFNKKLSSKDNFTFGLMYDKYLFDMIDSVLILGNYTTTTDNNDNADLSQGYLQWQHKFSNQFTINAGIHSQYFLYNNNFAIEPRLGLRYSLNNKHTINIGYGLHSQLQPITLYFVDFDQTNDILPNINLEFTKAHHFVIGHDFFLTQNIRLKTEVYYQQLFNVPIDTSESNYSLLNEGVDFALPERTGLTNEGKGRNYGVEITLEKFFSQGYYFLATTSLFESKYTASDNIERNTVYNGNFVYNVLAGKEFIINEKNSLSFDTRITYSGGRRYTPVNIPLSDFVGFQVLDQEQGFTEQYPAYFRWDFKLTWKLNYKKVAQQLALDILNVTNKQNVFTKEYNTETKQFDTTFQRGFFPVILYKVYF